MYADDEVMTCVRPVYSCGMCDMTSVLCVFGIEYRMESLTGTMYDTVSVTVEGVMTACAGMVTPGECVPTRWTVVGSGGKGLGRSVCVVSLVL